LGGNFIWKRTVCSTPKITRFLTKSKGEERKHNLVRKWGIRISGKGEAREGFKKKKKKKKKRVLHHANQVEWGMLRGGTEKRVRPGEGGVFPKGEERKR